MLLIGYVKHEVVSSLRGNYFNKLLNCISARCGAAGLGISVIILSFVAHLEVLSNVLYFPRSFF